MNLDKEVKLQERLEDLERYIGLLPTLHDRADREFFIAGIRTISESFGKEWSEEHANELLYIRLMQGYTIGEIIGVCCVNLDSKEDQSANLIIGCLYAF